MKTKKKRRQSQEHGLNIRAPRLFSDGERVYFIQKLYGLSMCFGQGTIQRTLDLPSGYSEAQGDRVQYLIKGHRLFFHAGKVTRDRGTYATWLGASQIVIVPRTEKTKHWLKRSMRQWREVTDHHNRIVEEMRFK
jgi:hypothetical protein